MHEHEPLRLRAADGAPRPDARHGAPTPRRGHGAVPDFTHVRPLLLALGEARTPDDVLRLLLRRLGRAPNVGLVRVWASADGSSPSDASRLVLVGEAGSTRALPGVRPVQPLVPGDDARPLSIRDLEAACDLPPALAWVRRERLGGVTCQPLVHAGRKWGQLDLFTRWRVPDEGVEWLRVIADRAAAALAALTDERPRDAKRSVGVAASPDVVAAEIPCIGKSPALRRVLTQLDRVAPTDATVLLLGESGTGKEVAARRLHARSRRSSGPLVQVNCAGLPEALFEAELFGHVRGAFTGAAVDRVGRFEAADGGTLLLDEVGELPLALQAKLLRALQEGTLERVGDTRTRRVDVRVVAATNRDLAADVAAGRFRADLFYRLHVVALELPPLRARSEDVVPLARHFLALHAAGLGRTDLGPEALDERAQRALLAHPWPGNVRELSNAIERAVVLSSGPRLELDLRAARTAPGAAAESPAGGETVWTEAELRLREEENLDRALNAAGGRVAGPGGAAELLGVNANTLAARLRRRAGATSATRTAGA